MTMTGRMIGSMSIFLPVHVALTWLPLVGLRLFFEAFFVNVSFGWTAISFNACSFAVENPTHESIVVPKSQVYLIQSVAHKRVSTAPTFLRFMVLRAVFRTAGCLPFRLYTTMH